MSIAFGLSLEDLNASDARRAALSYVSEAFAEALLDGIDANAFAEAALCAAMRELVAAYGEAHAAGLAERLAERTLSGEFSAQRWQ
jgi:hypothetical protein